MRLKFLYAFLLVLALAALIDVLSPPSFALADVIDAGPEGGVATSPPKLADVPQTGVATSPITVTAPAPQTPAPELSEIPEVYQRQGIWVAALVGLYALFTWLGKKGGPGSLLGQGRVATGVTAAVGFLGSMVDWRVSHIHDGWLYVLGTLLVGAAAVLNPHTVHTDEKGLSLGGGKGGGPP